MSAIRLLIVCTAALFVPKFAHFETRKSSQRGGTLGPSLVKAITESKIYIPIFTEKYASSKWCLQELAKMVECWKTGKGHLILPIFYLMDPRDVRHQEAGAYKEAFEQHSLKQDPVTVKEWRGALQVVGEMKGWHVTKSDGQGAIIDHVFTKVELHLRANYTLMTDELVGIDFRVEEVMRLLNLDSTSEKFVGIHGMGGFGKTTLAKAVYNKVSTQFDRCCFLENVREILSRNDGTVTLQNKIISNILQGDSSQARNASDGIQVIKDRVCKYKLLIVLDDIDERFKFEDMLGELENFSAESRFLITTRDGQVLEFLGKCKLYELEEMSYDHSLRLFSKLAFRADYPPEDYAALSMEFVQVAAGLPLALKVFGSLFFGKNKRFWKSKLIELKSIPASKVQERLKISYNELTDNEKQIFLDVACLFIGRNEEVPTYMWSDCDFYPDSTIPTLVQRSLLRITEKNEFWMHDHVRDLGRAIVREENYQNPHKRSRVWSNKDALNMLINGEGTDCVEALRVDLEGTNHELTNHEFKKLSGLRYLEVWNGRLVGDFKGVLPNLCWLRLRHCDSVPTDMNLKKLVAGKLKVVNLSRSYDFKEVPDLTSCRGLELLDFCHCREMHGELDIGNFRNLKLLGARNTQITRLKGEIGMLQDLQKIDFGGSGLAEIPVGISKLASLEFLELVSADPNRPELSEMLPAGLKSLTISSFSLSALPASLTCINLYLCENMQRLPNLTNLNKLTRLNMNDIGIREIPGLGELKVLETLLISSAPNLENLDGLENLLLLVDMNLIRCHILGKLPTLANLTKLQRLSISQCGLLTEIHGLAGPLGESLSRLELYECSSLGDIGFGALHLSTVSGIDSFA
ncbi:Disease resistance protein L6 [Linum perenne]